MVNAVLKYGGAALFSALWAPLWWLVMARGYSDHLDGRLFVEGLFLRNYIIYPMLGFWFSAASLSLAGMLLIQTARIHSLWTILPVTVISVILIYVNDFLFSPGGWGTLAPAEVARGSLLMALYIFLSTLVIWFHLLMAGVSRSRKTYTP